MSKSPKVSEARLSDLLTATGFRSASRWYGGYAWNRWNSTLGVSEWVLVGFAGKKDEAVSANVGVGITQTLAFGISHELLVEVADVKQMVDEYGFWAPGRGQAIIETAETAKAWERRVAETAPAAAECYALEHGNELLQRTTHARQRSSKLMQLLDSTKSLYQQIQELEARHGNAYRKEAERLAEWPGVMQVFDAEELYLLACCAVLTGDQGTAFRGLDPLKNEELMWQIQLVADGILLWERETETTKEHGRA
ncbi:MAG: hypothetical protein U0894_12880 [Pirellulales bacterium]